MRKTKTRQRERVSKKTLGGVGTPTRVAVMTKVPWYREPRGLARNLKNGT